MPDLDVLRGVGGVVARPEPVGPTSWQVVVDDAAATCASVRDALAHADAGAVEVRDHPVDYDESFVRIIERHRAEAAERAERGVAGRGPA